MNKKEVKSNGTSVAVVCKDGVTRLVPSVTVKAIALQKLLGISKN